jgi:hypothetical protein
MTRPRPASDLVDIMAVAQRLGVQVCHVRRPVHERRIPTSSGVTSASTLRTSILG